MGATKNYYVYDENIKFIEATANLEDKSFSKIINMIIEKYREKNDKKN